MRDVYKTSNYLFIVKYLNKKTLKIIMETKILTKEDKLKEIIKEQQKIIDLLSNKDIVIGLKSALEDFKNGRYTIVTS